MNKDLTVGNPQSVLCKFCLPLFGSIIFQQLYNIADSFVAGKFISDNALAAVGNSYEITLIFIAFAFGCNIGCSVLAAQLFGAKRYRDLKSAVYTALIASGVLCLLLMAIGIIFCGCLLRLIKTPDEVFCRLCFFITLQPASFPRLAIPKRRLSSSPAPHCRTSAWTSCSSPRSAWAWTAWRGRRSCARA